MLALLFIFPPLAAFGAESASPIQIHGDTVEYFNQEQKAVGTGHVVIDYQGAKLSADKVTVYTDTQKAFAEGHVVLTQKGSTFRGEQGEYDFRNKIGHVSKMDAEIAPSYYGKAERIERVSPDQYRAVNAYMTTCCGDRPFYKIQAKSIDIYPDEKVIVRHAVLWVQGVPVLFIPYYEQHFLDSNQLPVQLIPGRSSEWGLFALSKWRYHLVDSPGLKSKGNLLLDYRERKGFGGGVENYYRSDALGRGVARFYMARDDNPPQEAKTDRSRVQWRHQMSLGSATTLTTEWNDLSDSQVIKDYFYHEEYEKNAFPDSYVSLITAKPEYTFSILDRERVDDFLGVVERSPELRFDTHTRQFAETPFYLRQEVQFSNLQRKFANSDTDLQAIRTDLNETLSYAGRVGAVSVVPRVGTRQTYYSRRTQSDEDLIRGTVDPGLDVSTRFFKIYDTTIHAFGLDYNRIRHIFTPTASYNYRPNPTSSRTVLQQFDALDTLDKQNFIRFNLENKLQTQSHNSKNTLETSQIARVVPFFDTDLHTGYLENTGLDVELRPYPWLGIEGDTTYNHRTRDFDTANGDIYFDRGPWRVALGQRYVQHESSQMTAQLEWKMNSQWSFKLYERYEFQTGDSKEFEITATRVWNCVITDFTYNHAEGETFYFAVRLKAFPSVPFSLSQSYNHPKSYTPPEAKTGVTS